MKSDRDSRQNQPDSHDPLLSDGPSEFSHAANWEQRRLEILKFQKLDLNDPDCFAVPLAQHTGGLLEIGSHLEELILRKLSREFGQFTDIAEVTPAIDSYLRLSKQTERYANLFIRLAGIAKHAAVGKPTPPAAEFSALSPDESRSPAPTEIGTSPDPADRVKRAK